MPRLPAVHRERRARIHQTVGTLRVLVISPPPKQAPQSAALISVDTVP